MYIKKEYDFNDLYENSWSGAIDTLKVIEENDKEEEFMKWLENYFEEIQTIPTETEVNDLLWFESKNYIFECLGINQEEDGEEI